MIATALLFGLLGSFHCIGMCGPIAFLLPVDRTSSTKKVFQISLYHLGRLMAYAIIGVFFGLLGKSFSIFGLQQQLSIVVGVLMVVFVFFSPLKNSKSKFLAPLYTLIGKVKSKLGKSLKSNSTDAFLTIGFLNGFLPCGLVYMAVFGAIASSTLWYSALYMVFFGIGTVPLMTGTIYLGNFLNDSFKKSIKKITPLIIVFIGCLFIIRGLGLGIPYVSPKPISTEINANYDCKNQ